MAGNANNRNTGIRGLLALVGAPLRRRISADPVLASAFFAVILITAAAVAAIPMILNRVGDQGLFETLDDALVIQRGINVQLEGTVPAPESDPLAPVSERGESYRENLPDTVSEMIEQTQWAVDSTRNNHLTEDLAVLSGSFQRFFQFRYQSDIEEHIETVDGRDPAPAEPIMLSEAANLPEDFEDQEVPRYEVKIGVETAETLELGLGDQFVIQVDPEDQLNRGVPRGSLDEYRVVEVVGLFEPTDSESDFWFYDTRTFATDVFSDPNQTIYYSMGIPAEEVFPALQAINEPGAWRYSWRYFVDPAGVTMTDASQTSTDLRSVIQNRGPYQELADLNPNQASRQINIRSLLPTLLNGAEEQYRLTSAVLSLVVAGILTIGIALSGLLGALVASRRTPEIALMRSRGASAQQLGLSQIVEGILLALPGTIMGVSVALLLTGEPLMIDSILAAGAVGVAGVIALWLLTRRIRNVDLGNLLGRRADVPAGSSQRRIVAEALVVGMAIAGIILLRQRGVTTGAEQQGFDPYVAAVPVLAGLATGIIAIRLFPWLLRQLARLAGRRSDLVLFLGLRRIAEPSLGRHLPLVVMILALGMAVFAGAIWYSIETPETIAIEELDVEEAEELASTQAGVNEAFQQGITQGFWLTLLMAGVYAALAVICALALTSDERRRDVGYLRTMGASRGQALSLTLIEQTPSALLAGLLGAVFGGVLTWLVAPGLDIASLYPPEEPVVVGVNWLLASGQALALIAVAAGAAILFAWIARRSDLTDVLRAGE